jgi:uncharacterized caspase-like protein
VKRWELTFVGVNGWYWPSLVSWFAIGEFPGAWIAGEQFKCDIEIEYKLYAARAQKEMTVDWKGHARHDQTFDVDQWDRGWYPWSIAALPLFNIMRSDRAWQMLNESISPPVLNQIQKSLIKDSVFTYFAEHGPQKPPDAQKANKVALLIGAEKPKDPAGDITPLKTAEDIRLMQETLTKLGYHDVRDKPTGNRYVTFVDEAASLENVRSWLRNELRKLAPKDFVLIYYAGYGASEYDEEAPKDHYRKYLCLTDTDPKNLKDTGLQVSEIGEALRNAPVRYALVALDTSFAAQADVDPQLAGGRTLPNLRNPPPADKLTGANAIPFMSFLQDQIGQRGGERRCMVLSAADQSQAALEGYDLGTSGQGLFTKYLAEALLGQNDADTNRDGKIQPSEIASHVQFWVKSEANKRYATSQEVRQAGDPNFEVYLSREAVKPKK